MKRPARPGWVISPVTGGVRSTKLSAAESLCQWLIPNSGTPPRGGRGSYFSERSSVSAPGALVFTDSIPCSADSLLS
jgi:hypothetical protein